MLKRKGKIELDRILCKIVIEKHCFVDNYIEKGWLKTMLLSNLLYKKGARQVGLKVTTFSSRGRATRIYSYKTNRIHHLQSDNQLRIFLLLEWSDNVKVIQENVELKDLEETIYNVENLRLDRFRDKETNKLYKLHTNFLIEILRENQKEKIIAISIKSLSELERKTAIEKMEIERRYWKAKQISFYVITEKDIDKQVVENIKWVRETLLYKVIENKDELKEKLYYFLQDNKRKRLMTVLNAFDEEENLKNGTALFILRYLIAIKVIEIDMKQKLDLNDSIDNVVNF